MLRVRLALGLMAAVLALLLGPALYGGWLLRHLPGNYTVTGQVSGPLWAPTLQGATVYGPGVRARADTLRLRLTALPLGRRLQLAVTARGADLTVIPEELGESNTGAWAIGFSELDLRDTRVTVAGQTLNLPDTALRVSSLPGSPELQALVLRGTVSGAPVQGRLNIARAAPFDGELWVQGDARVLEHYLPGIEGGELWARYRLGPVLRGEWVLRGGVYRPPQTPLTARAVTGRARHEGDRVSAELNGVGLGGPLRLRANADLRARRWQAELRGRPEWGALAGAYGVEGSGAADLTVTAAGWSEYRVRALATGAGELGTGELGTVPLPRLAAEYRLQSGAPGALRLRGQARPAGGNADFAVALGADGALSGAAQGTVAGAPLRLRLGGNTGELNLSGQALGGPVSARYSPQGGNLSVRARPRLGTVTADLSAVGRADDLALTVRGLNAGTGPVFGGGGRLRGGALNLDLESGAGGAVSLTFAGGAGGWRVRDLDLGGVRASGEGELSTGGLRGEARLTGGPLDTPLAGPLALRWGAGLGGEFRDRAGRATLSVAGGAPRLRLRDLGVAGLRLSGEVSGPRPELAALSGTLRAGDAAGQLDATLRLSGGRARLGGTAYGLPLAGEYDPLRPDAPVTVNLGAALRLTVWSGDGRFVLRGGGEELRGRLQGRDLDAQGGLNLAALRGLAGLPDDLSGRAEFDLRGQGGAVRFDGALAGLRALGELQRTGDRLSLRWGELNAASASARLAGPLWPRAGLRGSLGYALPGLGSERGVLAVTGPWDALRLSLSGRVTALGGAPLNVGGALTPTPDLSARLGELRLSLRGDTLTAGGLTPAFAGVGPLPLSLRARLGGATTWTARLGDLRGGGQGDRWRVTGTLPLDVPALDTALGGRSVGLQGQGARAWGRVGAARLWVRDGDWWLQGQTGPLELAGSRVAAQDYRLSGSLAPLRAQGTLGAVRLDYGEGRVTAQGESPAVVGAVAVAPAPLAVSGPLGDLAFVWGAVAGRVRGGALDASGSLQAEVAGQPLTARGRARLETGQLGAGQLGAGQLGAGLGGGADLTLEHPLLAARLRGPWSALALGVQGRGPVAADLTGVLDLPGLRYRLGGPVSALGVQARLDLQGQGDRARAALQSGGGSATAELRDGDVRARLNAFPLFGERVSGSLGLGGGGPGVGVLRADLRAAGLRLRVGAGRWDLGGTALGSAVSGGGVLRGLEPVGTLRAAGPWGSARVTGDRRALSGELNTAALAGGPLVLPAQRLPLLLLPEQGRARLGDLVWEGGALRGAVTLPYTLGGAPGQVRLQGGGDRATAQLLGPLSGELSAPFPPRNPGDVGGELLALAPALALLPGAGLAPLALDRARVVLDRGSLRLTAQGRWGGAPLRAEASAPLDNFAAPGWRWRAASDWRWQGRLLLPGSALNLSGDARELRASGNVSAAALAPLLPGDVLPAGRLNVSGRVPLGNPLGAQVTVAGPLRVRRGELDSGPLNVRASFAGGRLQARASGPGGQVAVTAAQRGDGWQATGRVNVPDLRLYSDVQGGVSGDFAVNPSGAGGVNLTWNTPQLPAPLRVAAQGVGENWRGTATSGTSRLPFALNLATNVLDVTEGVLDAALLRPWLPEDVVTTGRLNVSGRVPLNDFTAARLTATGPLRVRRGELDSGPLNVGASFAGGRLQARASGPGGELSLTATERPGGWGGTGRVNVPDLRLYSDLQGSVAGNFVINPSGMGGVNLLWTTPQLPAPLRVAAQGTGAVWQGAATSGTSRLPFALNLGTNVLDVTGGVLDAALLRPWLPGDVIPAGRLNVSGRVPLNDFTAARLTATGALRVRRGELDSGLLNVGAGFAGGRLQANATGAGGQLSVAATQRASGWQADGRISIPDLRLYSDVQGGVSGDFAVNPSGAGGVNLTWNTPQLPAPLRVAAQGVGENWRGTATSGTSRLPFALNLATNVLDVTEGVLDAALLRPWLPEDVVATGQLSVSGRVPLNDLTAARLTASGPLRVRRGELDSGPLNLGASFAGGQLQANANGPGGQLSVTATEQPGGWGATGRVNVPDLRLYSDLQGSVAGEFAINPSGTGGVNLTWTTPQLPAPLRVVAQGTGENWRGTATSGTSRLPFALDFGTNTLDIENGSLDAALFRPWLPGDVIPAGRLNVSGRVPLNDFTAARLAATGSVRVVRGELDSGPLNVSASFAGGGLQAQASGPGGQLSVTAAEQPGGWGAAGRVNVPDLRLYSDLQGGVVGDFTVNPSGAGGVNLIWTTPQLPAPLRVAAQGVGENWRGTATSGTSRLPFALDFGTNVLDVTGGVLDAALLRPWLPDGVVATGRVQVSGRFPLNDPPSGRATLAGVAALAGEGVRSGPLTLTGELAGGALRLRADGAGGEGLRADLRAGPGGVSGSGELWLPRLGTLVDALPGGSLRLNFAGAGNRWTGALAAALPPLPGAEALGPVAVTGPLRLEGGELSADLSARAGEARARLAGTLWPTPALQGSATVPDPGALSGAAEGARLSPLALRLGGTWGRLEAEATGELSGAVQGLALGRSALELRALVSGEGVNWRAALRGPQVGGDAAGQGETLQAAALTLNTTLRVGDDVLTVRGTPRWSPERGFAGALDLSGELAGQALAARAEGAGDIALSVSGLGGSAVGVLSADLTAPRLDFRAQGLNPAALWGAPAPLPVSGSGQVTGSWAAPRLSFAGDVAGPGGLSGPLNATLTLGDAARGRLRLDTPALSGEAALGGGRLAGALSARDLDLAGLLPPGTVPPEWAALSVSGRALLSLPLENPAAAELDIAGLGLRGGPLDALEDGVALSGSLRLADGVARADLGGALLGGRLVLRGELPGRLEFAAQEVILPAALVGEALAGGPVGVTGELRGDPREPGALRLSAEVTGAVNAGQGTVRAFGSLSALNLNGWVVPANTAGRLYLGAGPLNALAPGDSPDLALRGTLRRAGTVASVDLRGAWPALAGEFAVTPPGGPALRLLGDGAGRYRAVGPGTSGELRLSGGLLPDVGGALDLRAGDLLAALGVVLPPEFAQGAARLELSGSVLRPRYRLSGELRVGEGAPLALSGAGELLRPSAALTQTGRAVGELGPDGFALRGLELRAAGVGVRLTGGGTWDAAELRAAVSGAAVGDLTATVRGGEIELGGGLRAGGVNLGVQAALGERWTGEVRLSGLPPGLSAGPLRLSGPRTAPLLSGEGTVLGATAALQLGPRGALLQLRDGPGASARGVYWWEAPGGAVGGEAEWSTPDGELRLALAGSVAAPRATVQAASGEWRAGGTLTRAGGVLNVSDGLQAGTVTLSVPETLNLAGAELGLNLPGLDLARLGLAQRASLRGVLSAQGGGTARDLRATFDLRDFAGGGTVPYTRLPLAGELSGSAELRGGVGRLQAALLHPNGRAELTARLLPGGGYLAGVAGTLQGGDGVLSGNAVLRPGDAQGVLRAARFPLLLAGREFPLDAEVNLAGQAFTVQADSELLGGRLGVQGGGNIGDVVALPGFAESERGYLLSAELRGADAARLGSELSGELSGEAALFSGAGQAVLRAPELRVGEQPLPTRVEAQQFEGRWALSGVVGGSTVSGTLEAGRLRGDAQLRGLPLGELLAAFYPGLPGRGNLTGLARLDVPLTDPLAGSAALVAERVEVSAGAERLSGAGFLRYEDRELQALRLNLSGAGTWDVSGRYTREAVDLRADFAGTTFTPVLQLFPQAAALGAEARGTVRVEVGGSYDDPVASVRGDLSGALAGQALELRGLSGELSGGAARLGAEARTGGAVVSQGTVTATARVENGRITDPSADYRGNVLSRALEVGPVSAQVRETAPGRFAVAAQAQGGAATAQGELSPALDLRVTLNNFAVVSPDLYVRDGLASGELTVRGVPQPGAAGRFAVEGAVELNRAVLGRVFNPALAPAAPATNGNGGVPGFVSPLPPALRTFAPEAADTAPITGPEGGALARTDLNIDLRFPAGLRLDETLARADGEGELNVSGTAAAPLVAGEVRVLRGSVFLRENEFVISQGEARFPGTGALPEIDVSAAAGIRDGAEVLNVSLTLRGFFVADPEAPGGQRLELETRLSSPQEPSEERLFALVLLGSRDAALGDLAGTLTESALRTALNVLLLGEVERVLGRALGLDVFRIRADTVQGQLTTQFTLGQRIVQGVYVQYVFDTSGQSQFGGTLSSPDGRLELQFSTPLNVFAAGNAPSTLNANYNFARNQSLQFGVRSDGFSNRVGLSYRLRF